MELYKKHISDLGRIVTGKTPRTSIPDNYGGKIPFLTPSDDLTGKYSPQTNKTITQLGLNEVKNCLLPSKSVCVSCIGSDLGKAVITNEPTVTNQQFNSIIPNEENDADFVYYLMIIVGKHLNFLSKTSTAVPIINKSTFSDYEVDVPSLSDQRRIAKILSSLDDKIECNRRINENLEQQAQALFKSWFVDFEPFKDQPFVESELGMIPHGWKVQEAQEVFDINIGKTPPRKESEWFSESNEDNVWVSIADMGSCGTFISDSSEYLTDEAVNRFNIQLVEKDSILLSFKLTVGRVAIADTRLTTNEAIARFILPKKLYREFLYLYLKQYKYGNLGSTSSIATAVNSKTIKGMKLLIPNSEVIEEFSMNTKPLFEKIRTVQQESRHLAELRDTLLPRLMSGELHVNDM
jgi:type I restriction enzyme S subunit